MRDKAVLLDSDAFVGWMVKQDAHHEAVTAGLEKIRAQQLQPVTTNLVITETATLLSYRQSQEKARVFLEFSRQVETLVIDEEMHYATVELMRRQTRKKTSFVDMGNVVAMRALRIPLIFSFDRVYPTDFGLRPLL